MKQFDSENSTTTDVSANELKRRLARLSPEQLAVVQARLQQRQRSDYESIRALPDDREYPLSLHQRRLWFIEQFNPGTPLYNVTRAIRIRGSLDRAALWAAIQALVDRHEALRTTIHQVNGEVKQRINPAP